MSKLPETDSITALAELWQTHDLTDLDDTLVEVTEPVFQRPPGQSLAGLPGRSRHGEGGPSRQPV